MSARSRHEIECDIFHALRALCGSQRDDEYECDIKRIGLEGFVARYALRRGFDAPREEYGEGPTEEHALETLFSRLEARVHKIGRRLPRTRFERDWVV